MGVHGSPTSLQALRFALGHARAFDATLIPVIAWEPPGGDSAYRRFPPFLSDAWALEAEQRLLAAFDEGLGGPPTDVPLSPLVVRGPAGQVLVEVADRENDLLVVGKNQRGLLHRLSYRSTTTHCVAHAHCAVIVVQPSRLAVELRHRRSAVRQWQHSLR
ncbi:MAG TPA: universal stress protein [Actinocrinis sp.]|uniref:universal stress protein n=1 Tax=Actinocrinis sp. TaxID=1920516 RepID=UPI002DDD5E4F|nr:universal stress protein [Actinocrinis sp.]HEV3173571.1 universal stress protein [Actinocrinis sp.]